MRKPILTFSTPVFAAILLASPGFGQAVIAPDLLQPKGEEIVEVLVQYKTQPSNNRRLRSMQARTGRQARQFENIPVAHVAVNAADLAALEQDPEVISISPDREVTSYLEKAQASINYYSLSNYFDGINRAKAAGVVIAILDSGVYASHKNFGWYLEPANSRISTYSKSFVDSTTDDLYGHGTHVAGIAAGMDNVTTMLQGVTASTSYWGIAPDATILNLKVLDSTGKGTDSGIIAAIDYAITLKNTNGVNIRVMNLSLGRPIYTSYKLDPLCLAVEKAWKNGIVVVVAAGNNGRDNTKGTNGYGTISAPGNDPYVITVGAVNSKADYDKANDVIATYSSKGPSIIDHIAKPDLVAPGNRIGSYQAPNSTLVKGNAGNRIPKGNYIPGGGTTPSTDYFTLSGTSMAAPIVAGTVAMMLDKDPTLTPDQVKARLMKTAWRGFPAKISTYDDATKTTYYSNHDLFTIGAGMLDAWAAYNNNDKPAAIVGVAASPTAYYDTVSKSVKLKLNTTGSSNVVWGDSTFPTNVVWGDSVLRGNSVVWGENVVWGDSTMAGSNVVWGDKSPWATSTTKSENMGTIIQGEN